MEGNEEIVGQLHKLINAIQQNNRKPRTYGHAPPLHFLEVHTIGALDPERPLTATDLAVRLGVTKGAVTQVTDKLREKNLVDKVRATVDSRTILHRLTPLGIEVKEIHQQREQVLKDRLFSYLDSLTESQREGIRGFFTVLKENYQRMEKP